MYTCKLYISCELTYYVTWYAYLLDTVRRFGGDVAENESGVGEWVSNCSVKRREKQLDRQSERK